jgi:mevalonate kinase
MPAATVVSPAKLILMGEHAVVYGRPALIATIDLWFQVHLETRSESGVHLQIKDLDHEEATGWSEIQAHTEAVKERWEQYQSAPDAGTFAEIRDDDPAYLVKVALGEAARRWQQVTSAGLEVTIRSQQPIGAGFGSSAALASAIVYGLSTLYDLERSYEALYPVVMDVERRQHGTPSGVDPAALLHGGLLWADAHADGGTPTPLNSSFSVPDRLEVYYTGAPNESTGTVVDSVRSRREADPDLVEATLDRMATATYTVRDILTEERAPSADLGEAIRQFEKGLEDLGVVPSPIQDLIRFIEGKGGAAKISGAGALSGPGGGPLLVYHPDPNAPLWGNLQQLSELNVRLGVDGVHETSAHAQSHR